MAFPATQTTLPDKLPPFIAGQLADLWTEENGDVQTATSEEATAGIPFGVMVGEGEGEDGVLLLAATDDALAGIAVYDPIDPLNLDADGKLKPGWTFDRLTVGRVAVIVENAVSKDSEVHVRAVAVDPEQAGAFRAGADGADTISLVGIAKFVTETTGAGIAIVDIDLRNAALATADS